MLYEFYYEKYVEIKNIDDKLNNYAEHFKNIGWGETNNMNVDINSKYIRNKKNMVKQYVIQDFQDLPKLQSIHSDYKLLCNIDHSQGLTKYLLNLLFNNPKNDNFMKFIEYFIKIYPMASELEKLNNANDIAQDITKSEKIDQKLRSAIKANYGFETLIHRLKFNNDNNDYDFIIYILSAFALIQPDKFGYRLKVGDLSRVFRVVYFCLLYTSQSTRD